MTLFLLLQFTIWLYKNQSQVFNLNLLLAERALGGFTICLLLIDILQKAVFVHHVTPVALQDNKQTVVTVLLHADCAFQPFYLGFFLLLNLLKSHIFHSLDLLINIQ